MNKLFSPRAKAYFFSNLMAFAAIAVSKFLLADVAESGLFIFSEFVIIPLGMGLICAWFWKDEEYTSLKKTGYCCINAIIAIALSYVFLKEGSICLIIVSPLLVLFIVAGTMLGQQMFKKNNQTLNVSVVALLLFVFITDSVSKHYYQNEVSDTIVIKAPVNKVWNYVVAYDKNTEPENYWLFKIGMPSPLQSTVDGYHIGANRKCIFSNGYIFDEKIVAFDINHNLTFDITNQPRDPEIMNHIDILRGQFILKDNGDGTTTVTGNSWYRLYVFPTWYYDRWAESITRNVHLRVMEHIKHLAEAK
jgi:hypothetical protein